MSQPTSTGQCSCKATLETAKLQEGTVLRGKGCIQALQPLQCPTFITSPSMITWLNWKFLGKREVESLPTCSYSAAGVAVHAFSILPAGARDLGNTEQDLSWRASGTRLVTGREGR